MTGIANRCRAGCRRVYRATGRVYRATGRVYRATAGGRTVEAGPAAGGRAMVAAVLVLVLGTVLPRGPADAPEPPWAGHASADIAATAGPVEVVGPADGADRSGATDRSAVGAEAGADQLTFRTSGTRTWRMASGRPRTLGTSGRVLTFRVAVEGGIGGVTPDTFADAVVSALGDRRGWTGSGQRRMKMVARGQPADFIIYLASPATRDKLCGGGRDRYTSCRNGDRVVINVARWAHGVPHFRGALAAYRTYVINHEVGHRLGYGHQRCPGRGRPAPVMQQQTLGLHGCAANPWPMRGARVHTGPPGAYADPVPAVVGR